jgi:hypothetical protein
VEDDIALALNRLVETEEAVTALRKALLQTEVLAEFSRTPKSLAG